MAGMYGALSECVGGRPGCAPRLGKCYGVAAQTRVLGKYKQST